MSTRPRPFAFVLMPFAPEFDDTYQLAIRAACDEAGAYAERVDEQIFAGNILERIYNQIAKADLVIADMSGRSANVFYEVGYAHALGKTTLLLTRDEADIPFDLRHYPHIVYGGSLSMLKGELARRVAWHLAHPSQPEATEPEVVVRINDVTVPSPSSVPLRFRGANAGTLDLTVALNNRSAREIRTLRFEVGLIVPSVVSRATDREGIVCRSVLVDGRRLLMATRPLQLLPEQWDLVTFRLTPEDNATGIGAEHEACLRLYFDSGVLDFPFTATIVPAF